MKEIITQITSDVKALIFDLDGTLANTIPLHFEAWLLAGKELGFKITKEMIIEHSGTPTVKVAKILSEQYKWNLDPEEITENKYKHYWNIVKNHGKVQAIQPILEIAKQYHGKLPLAVGTGSTRDGAMKSLEDIDAVHLFDIIVTATDVKSPKPHPETFLISSRYFNVRPEDCIVFEDGAAGIKAAKAAGMKLIDVRDYL
jgi:beta-phosphoglucomutase-like phosphatase (HAD superfamily)